MIATCQLGLVRDTDLKREKNKKGLNIIIKRELNKPTFSMLYWACWTTAVPVQDESSKCTPKSSNLWKDKTISFPKKTVITTDLVAEGFPTNWLSSSWRWDLNNFDLQPHISRKECVFLSKAKNLYNLVVHKVLSMVPMVNVWYWKCTMKELQLLQGLGVVSTVDRLYCRVRLQGSPQPFFPDQTYK